MPVTAPARDKTHKLECTLKCAKGLFSEEKKMLIFTNIPLITFMILEMLFKLC